MEPLPYIESPPPFAIPRHSTTKIFVKLSSTQAVLLSRRCDSNWGGLQRLLVIGNQSVDESLNTTADLWRTQTTHSLVGNDAAYAFRRISDLTGTVANATDTITAGGSWSTTPIGVSAFEPTATAGGTTGVGLALTSGFVVQSTTTPNNVKEYTVTVGPRGYANVALVSSASGAMVEISVDGQILETISTTISPNPASRLILREYRLLPGTRKIRIRHVSGTNLYLLGVNLVTLASEQVSTTATYDTYITTRNNNPYINSAGANEYAFYERDAGLWGGSAHGGETQQAAPKWVFDSVSVTPTDFVPIVFKSLKLIQDTKIDWGVVGGVNRYLRLESTFLFGSNGITDRRVHAYGYANLSQAYTYMNCASLTFTDVVWPQRVTLSADGRAPVTPRGGEIWQRDPVTNQDIVNQFTLFPRNVKRAPFGTEVNAYGGPYIERNASGPYYKPRYGPKVEETNNSPAKLFTDFSWAAVTAYM